MRRAGLLRNVRPAVGSADWSVEWADELAAPRTPIRNRLVATTVETVHFTRPERVDFRLVRGPVPHVVEEFVLTERDGGTELTYRGELGTDLGPAGQWWADLVARRWEHAVTETLDAVKIEAERRASRPQRAHPHQRR